MFSNAPSLRRPVYGPHRTAHVLPLRTAPAGVLGTTQFVAAMSKAAWIRVGLLYIILGVFASLDAMWVGLEEWGRHGLWCIAMGALGLPAIVKGLRKGFGSMLCDHRTMFTIAFVVYFAFGASMLAYGTANNINQTLTYYNISASAAVKINGMNAVGFGVALVVASLSKGRWLGKSAAQISSQAASIPIPLVVGVMAVVSTVASLFTFVADYGFLQQVTISGFVRLLDSLSMVVIMIGVAHNGHMRKQLLVVGVVMTILEVVMGLLMFNKSQALLPLAALTGGLALKYARPWVAIGGFAIVIVLYVILGSVLNYGRNTLGIDSEFSQQTRSTVVAEGWEAYSAGDESADYNTWGRLCYTAPQVAAVDFFDAGVGGSDFSLVPWLFVPRFLAKEKPIITQTSADLHYKIAGAYGSSTGIGIFISGYYNGGWLGLLLMSAVCGWIVAQTSAVAFAVMEQRSLVLLPLAAWGVLIAFRIDGHFVADYIGAFAYLLYVVVGLRLLTGSRPVAFTDHRA